LSAALRRRWWVIPVVTVLTAAVAYGVQSLLPQRYRAEAVLVVPAGYATHDLGSIDQSSRLAATYARLVPDDPAVLARVAAAASLRRGAAARGTSATHVPDTPILRLRFRAATRRAAVRGAVAMAAAVVGATPRSQAVAPASIRVARLPRRAERASASRGGQRPAGWAATAVVVASAGSSTSMNAGDANVLAKTYANLIPGDPDIMGRAARRTGLTRAVARERASVTAEFDTSLLRVRFQDARPDVAVAGARAIAEAASGPRPASPRISSRSLEAVELPTEATRASNLRRDAVPVAAILGLCLAVVLVLALERADSRIDDARTLGELAVCPATSLRATSIDAIVAVLERWERLSRSEPVRVGLLPATPKLVAQTASAVQYLTAIRSTLTPSSALTIEAGDVPGGAGAGERLAAACDVVVLVAAHGTRAAAVRRALRVLEEFGAPPNWALLVSRSRRRGAGWKAVSDSARDPGSVPAADRGAD
jgi:capsular polysaccharide biosynthesis protein